VIHLEEHRPEWAAIYRAEAERIRAAAGDALSTIEHVGSTAVPGLRAKPVIDIAAAVTPGVDPFGLEPLLASARYERHRAGPKNHGVYVRWAGGARTHILHVFDAETWPTSNHRLFRDKLLRDPEARRRYDALKVALASTAADGRAYTAAKRELIEELANDERARRGLPATRVWEK
jgi:GrpB-like predicted nucleotidyltransferase (UPF0157 family)